MPSYEYSCKNPECVGEFEEFHSSSDDAKLKYCPHCKEAGRGEQNPVERLISGGAGRGIVQLTNKEFAATLGVEGRNIHKESIRNENFAANYIGESKYKY